MKLIIPFFVVFIHVYIFAGSNENAKVYLDYDYRTEVIDNEITYIESGEECCVALIVENAVALHSYSFKIKYTQDIIEFIDATKRISFSSKAFIESNNGKIAVFLPIPRENFIEIAVTLSGKEKQNTVFGKGVLGYLTFKCKKTGDPEINIKEVNLVDINGTLDVLDNRDVK